MENSDWNLVVRRSQEVVELSLKGALKVLGMGFPKVHDVSMVFSSGAKEKDVPLSEDVLARMQSSRSSFMTSLSIMLLPPVISNG
jgi:HEPN domain-containing protein